MNKELKANIDTLILKYFDYIEEEKLKEVIFNGKEFINKNHREFNR